MILGYPRLKFFFLVYQIFCLKKSECPDFFFLWSQLHLGKLHMGKLHREHEVTGRIFQALATQIDTVAFIYKIILCYSNL